MSRRGLLCVMLQGADKLEHVATEHFWMSGMYWGLTAMALMGKLDQMDSAKILDWVSLSVVVHLKDVAGQGTVQAGTDTVAAWQQVGCLA